MLQFISFGSGSSGNCYLLYTETESIMIDVGMGTRTLKKHLTDYGIDLSYLKAILVTHDHADHVKSVGSLSNDLFVPVYTTQKVHHGINENYCVRKKIKSGFDRTIEKNKTFNIGEFEITAFHVPHDSTDCIGFCVKHNDICFCLMTDVGHVTDEMKKYIQQANYLVIEANFEHEKLMQGPYPIYLKERIISGSGHLSNKKCGEILANNATPNLRHVWLAHLSAENNHPELARYTVERELRAVGIAPGKDFLLDVLKRNSPSEIYKLV